MPAILSMEQLAFKRGKRFILNDLDAAFEEGQLIGLIGPNGTGKSTLLRLLARLLKPETGAVFFNGQNLAGMTAVEVAKAITYMPQNTVLEYPFTVEEVVMMGRHPYRKRWQLSQRADYEIVRRAIHETGIAHLKDRLLPSLSGGERQLVFLAKAIAQQSKILLLDEPTSDLDIYHQVQICDILRTLVKEGKTVIAAIHDINLAARCCDRLMMIRDGEIIAFGGPDQVLTKENLLEVFSVNTFIYQEPFHQSKQVLPYSMPQNESAL